MAASSTSYSNSALSQFYVGFLCFGFVGVLGFFFFWHASDLEEHVHVYTCKYIAHVQGHLFEKGPVTNNLHVNSNVISCTCIGKHG